MSHEVTFGWAFREGFLEEARLSDPGTTKEGDSPDGKMTQTQRLVNGTQYWRREKMLDVGGKKVREKRFRIGVLRTQKS